MRGRPRKPTVLHLLQGTWRADRHNSAEPQPKRIKPQCPKHIQGEGRREWRRKCEEIADGVLTRADRAALERYCLWYAIGHKIVSDPAKQAKLSKVLKTASGYPILSPLVTLFEKACGQMDKFDTEFGCTAAARTRIKIEQPKPVDPFEAYKKKKRA